MRFITLELNILPGVNFGVDVNVVLLQEKGRIVCHAQDRITVMSMQFAYVLNLKTSLLLLTPYASY